MGASAAVAGATAVVIAQQDGLTGPFWLKVLLAVFAAVLFAWVGVLWWWEHHRS
jgi:hypothetical protein